MNVSDTKDGVKQGDAHTCITSSVSDKNHPGDFVFFGDYGDSSNNFGPDHIYVSESDALDKFANTIDFYYLSATRNTKSAKRFLGKALSSRS